MYKLYVGSFEHNKGFHIIILDDDLKLISDNFSDKFGYNSYLYCEENNFILSTVEVKEMNGKYGGKIIVAEELDDNNYKVVSCSDSFGLNPCHITYNKENRLVATSNYDSGTFSLFSLLEDHNLSLKQKLTFYKNSLIHCSLFNNNNIHIIDKGLSKIYTLNLDIENSPIKTTFFGEDIQPRHLVKGDNNYFYLISEYKPLIITLEYRNDYFNIIDIKDLSKEKNCSGCSIKYDKNLKILYITIRGTNEIRLYSTYNVLPELIQAIPSFGFNPRDIDISNSSVVVANLDSNNLSFYKKENDGSLAFFDKYPIKAPSFVKIKKC